VDYTTAELGSSTCAVREECRSIGAKGGIGNGLVLGTCEGDDGVESWVKSIVESASESDDVGDCSSLSGEVVRSAQSSNSSISSSSHSRLQPPEWKKLTTYERWGALWLKSDMR